MKRGSGSIKRGRSTARTWKLPFKWAVRDDESRVRGDRSPQPITLIYEETESEVEGSLSEGITLVPATAIESVCGWEVADGIACTVDGRQCDSDTAVEGAYVAVEPLAGAVGAGTASWTDGNRTALAIGSPGRSDGQLPIGSQAPEVDLHVLAGGTRSSAEFNGQRRLILAFASWCGCREDLPAWQALMDDLGDEAPVFVAVAVDEHASDVRPWVSEVDLPVRMDPNRTFCSAYGIVNVPTVIWIDQHDRIVRPTSQVFADNRLTAHHGIDCASHHEALRAWARGEKDSDPQPIWEDPIAPIQRSTAQAEFRLGLWLLRNGHRASAAAHFESAGQLAPDDLTIRRASLQLLDVDPFGDRFVDLYRDWAEHSGGLSYG